MPDLPGFAAASTLIARLRSLVRGALDRRGIEDEMGEEFLHHIEMRAEHLMRDGLAPEEAVRRARIEFGQVETHKEQARASRGLWLFDRVRFSMLDVKLGVRMLRKYPGMTLVAIFALGLGIPVGLAPIHVANSLMAPLPIEDGDRVWALRYWDVATTNSRSTTSYELARWRDELSSFTTLGAARSMAVNLGSEDGRAAPVSGAEVTASTFDILRVRPLLGRGLVAEDEIVGGPNVVLVGENLWRSRFGGDPNIAGSTVRIGGVPYTVVGVMPVEFRFPVDQALWVPLREVSPAEPSQGVPLWSFGRLRDGVTPDEAQAEVSAAGKRIAAEFPEANGRLLAEVVPFALLFAGIPRGGLAAMPGFYAFQLLATVLLLVACANVAMLIFARTATRFRELAVRTALGASRARIVSQMFAESLVLAVVAAGFGLILVQWGLGRVRTEVETAGLALPYWFSLDVSREAVVWALGLAVISAAAASIAPALKITGANVQRNIQRARAPRAGIRFGGVTTALVIADIAIAVTVIGLAVGLANQLRVAVNSEEVVGIPADEYLTTRLSMPLTESRGQPDGLDPEAFATRFGVMQRELVDRLRADPSVRSVAVASALPRMDHPRRRLEIDAGDSAGEYRAWDALIARVDVDYFDALGQPVLAGRSFDRADLGENRSVVIVNTTFVERVLGQSNPIGRRIRLAGSGGDAPSSWYEIVGVVGPLGMDLINPRRGEGVYFPAAPGEIHPMQLGVRPSGDPETFAPRLREIVNEVSPELMMSSPVVLDTVYEGDWYLLVAVTGGLALLVVILVALAASAIYAMTSFAVSERTREIGIRTALGATRGSIVRAISGRAMFQLGVGTLLGIPLASRAFFEIRRDAGAASPALDSLFLALLLGIGVTLLISLVACAPATLRALRIEPTDALRSDA